METKIAVLVIDLQERLLPVMHDSVRVQARTRLLLSAATLLGMPVVVTEQYPKGLGPTTVPVASVVPGFSPMEKTAFSCFGATGFMERLAATGCRRIAVCGIEAHVCVYQTVRELLKSGYSVDLVEDAISSRSVMDRDIGIRRMLSEGAKSCSVEMLLFEVMGDAKHPAFRDVSKLVKEAGV